MPRQRMIKPDFFDSGSLAECSRDARLLFVGLWVMGDDTGCQKWAPRKIARQVFPYDDIEPAELLTWMAELEESGCIRYYEAENEQCVCVPNFSVYQTVKNPSKTTVPRPPENIGKLPPSGYFSKILRDCYGGDTPVLPQDSHTISYSCGSDGETAGYHGTGVGLTHNMPPSKERSKEVISSSPHGEEEEITLGESGIEGDVCPECGSTDVSPRGDRLKACLSCGSVWEVCHG